MNPTEEPNATVSEEPKIIKEMMSIEPDKISFVTGRERSSIKVNRIYEIYRVNIVIPSDITIERPTEMVTAANNDIEERLATSYDEFLHRRGPYRANYRS